MYKYLIESIDFYKFITQHQIELIKKILSQYDIKKEDISSIFLRNTDNPKYLMEEINNFLIITKNNNINKIMNSGNDYSHVNVEKVDECEYENFVMKCHKENKVKISRDIEEFNGFLNNLVDFSSHLSKNLNI